MQWLCLGMQDSLAIHKMVVPTLEIIGPAIRTWRQIGDSYSPMPQKVTYFDLQVYSHSGLQHALELVNLSNNLLWSNACLTARAV